MCFLVCLHLKAVLESRCCNLHSQKGNRRLKRQSNMLQVTQLVGGRAGMHAHDRSFLSPACNAPSWCSLDIISSGLSLVLISVIIFKTYLTSSAIKTQPSLVLWQLTTKQPFHKADTLFLNSEFLKLGVGGISPLQGGLQVTRFEVCCFAWHTQSSGLRRSKQGRSPPLGPSHDQVSPSGRSEVSRLGSFRGRPGLLRGLSVLGVGRWGRSCRPRGSSSAGL